mgnify:CR=1 FL=1
MDSQKTNSPENITWSELRKQTVQANEMQFHKLIILLFRWMKICRERVNVDKIFQLKKSEPLLHRQESLDRAGYILFEASQVFVTKLSLERI